MLTGQRCGECPVDRSACRHGRCSRRQTARPHRTHRNSLPAREGAAAPRACHVSHRGRHAGLKLAQSRHRASPGTGTLGGAKASAMGRWKVRHDTESKRACRLTSGSVGQLSPGYRNAVLFRGLNPWPKLHRTFTTRDGLYLILFRLRSAQPQLQNGACLTSWTS